MNPGPGVPPGAELAIAGITSKTIEQNNFFILTFQTKKNPSGPKARGGKTPRLAYAALVLLATCRRTRSRVIWRLRGRLDSSRLVPASSLSIAAL